MLLTHFGACARWYGSLLKQVPAACKIKLGMPSPHGVTL